MPLTAPSSVPGIFKRLLTVSRKPVLLLNVAFILPHLRPLKQVHNFTIESQVLLHAPLSFTPTWVPHPKSQARSEDVVSEAIQNVGNDHLEAVAEAAVAREVDNGRNGAWQVDGDQIKEFVNSEQWSLGESRFACTTK
jgi:phosphatidylinositol glycan class S